MADGRMSSNGTVDDQRHGMLKWLGEPSSLFLQVLLRVRELGRVVKRNVAVAVAVEGVRRWLNDAKQPQSRLERLGQQLSREQRLLGKVGAIERDQQGERPIARPGMTDDRRYQQHGHSGVPKDSVGDTAVQHPAQAAASMRRHHDHVCALAVGGVQDGVDRIVVIDMWVRCDAAVGQTACRAAKVLLSATRHVDLRVARVSTGERMGLDGLDEHDATTGSSCQRGGVWERPLRQWGPIEWNEDGLQHVGHILAVRLALLRLIRSSTREDSLVSFVGPAQVTRRARRTPNPPVGVLRQPVA